MPVAIEAELPFAPDRVWALVSDFGALARWHPALIACSVQGAGIGARRRAEFAGWWAVEELIHWSDAEATLGYRVVDSSRPEIIGVSASMTMASVPGGTRLSWSSGHEDDHPHAADVNAGLAAYYPTRIAHLRAALEQDDSVAGSGHHVAGND